jgi:hypothetical protein
VVTPDEAKGLIRDAAIRFAAGEATVVEMWSALHSNLHDLCRDEPLTGDFLDLFQSLERWEAAVSDERKVAEAEVRSVAARLGTPIT